MSPDWPKCSTPSCASSALELSLRDGELTAEYFTAEALHEENRSVLDANCRSCGEAELRSLSTTFLVAA